MSSNTDELFELCKEVAGKTEWSGTDYFYCSGNIMHRLQMDDDDFLGEVVPLYTSDYLLEKLPNDVILKKTEDGDYRSYAPKTMAIESILADTPSIALLKLTLALSNKENLTTNRRNDDE